MKMRIILKISVAVMMMIFLILFATTRVDFVYTGF